MHTVNTTIDRSSIYGGNQPSWQNQLNSKKNETQRDLLLSFVFHNTQEVREVVKDLNQYLASININEEENKKYHRIVYQILIELIENISKHSQLSPANKTGFYITKNGNNLFFRTIGFCEYKDYFKLKRINQLNISSRDEVKEMFLNRMSNGNELSDRGGAGLGYFRIAKLIRRYFPNIQTIFELEKIQEKNNLINFHISIKIPKPENTKKPS